MTQIQIEITSDTLCPYCYMGKKNLEKAIETYRESHPESDFEVLWKPYYLNPAMKKSGYDKKSIYEFKYGQHTGTLLERMVAAGPNAGIDFTRVRGTTGNSRQSQKLIALAGSKSPELQSRLMDLLFKGHFEDGEDITDRKFLVAAGVAAGLDLKEAARMLDSEVEGEKVDAEVLRARARNITSVPTYTIQGKYRVGGMQEPEVFVELFEKIRAQQAQ